MLLLSVLMVVFADININESLKNIVGVFAAFVGGGSALAFLRAGFLWMFASENPMAETKARHAFGAAIVGTIICLGAITLANLVTGAIK